jgi:hypothetical protein
MSFLFASSHPSEDNRPQEEEEEEEQGQPMQRSGRVRAFSHLPEPGQGEPAAPRLPISLPGPPSRPKPSISRRLKLTLKQTQTATGTSNHLRQRAVTRMAPSGRSPRAGQHHPQAAASI